MAGRVTPAPHASFSDNAFTRVQAGERSVFQRLRNQQGITIIETTVILSVLFILAGVMSPIVSESVTTARAVKAKSDASMIAMGIINFQKDLGADSLALSGMRALAQAVEFPEVLMTSGSVPEVEDPESEPSELPAMTILARPGNGNGNGNGGNGDGSEIGTPQRRQWLEASAEPLDDHLMTNRKGYRFRKPGEYGGWNGPYLSAEVEGDPWGNQFMVNTKWFDGGTTAADSQGNPRRAVFVVSAGADGVIQTPYDQPITDARAYGDDIVIRIQ